MLKKLIILIISSILLFTSCETAPGNIIHESGYFQYRIIDIDNDDLEEALIMGLSEEGKKQETLVIPTTIDEYEVISLGDNNGFQGKEGKFESESLKTIYISNHIINIANSNFFEELSLDTIYFGNYSQMISHSWLNTVLCANSLYLSNDFFNSNIEYFSNYKALDKCDIANVLYDLNYGDNNIFMVDDCDGTIVNILPPNPIREGYEFIGWYKESECINKWDFENDIVPSKEYDKNGDYILKETKLYAKWEEQ